LDLKNFHLAVTYLQFPIQICFLAIGWPSEQLLSSCFHHVTINFEFWSLKMT